MGPCDSLALIPGSEPACFLPDAVFPIWTKTSYSKIPFTSLQGLMGKTFLLVFYLEFYFCLHTWEHAG